MTPDEQRRLDALLSVPSTFRGFVESVHRTFQWYEAQVRIGEALEAVARDELRRLMIFMPPQEGKTELVSKLFPAYYLTCWPDRWVGVGSYSFGLAKTFSRAARGYYRETVSQSGDEGDSVEQWETPRKGGLWAVGRGGSATGKPAHLAIIDDPLKDRAEAESEAVRQNLHDWYGSVINMRLQPKNACVIVHTRWHEDDLSGRLLELERTATRPERWTVIELPGIAEAKSERPVYPPSVTVLPDWRAPGEPLSGRYGPERYEQIRVVSGTREYEAQVQQRPAPSQGTIFNRNWWQYYTDEEKPQRFDRVILSLDAAFKNTDGSDFVALHAYGRLGSRVYLLARETARLSFTETVAACRQMMARYPKAVLYVEDKANGSAVIDTLRHDLHGIVAVEPEGGKIARAYACQGDVEHHRVFLPAWERDGDFVRQAASFPSAPHDDDVDAFTQAMAVIRQELREAIQKVVEDVKPTDRAMRLIVKDGKLVTPKRDPRTLDEWVDRLGEQHRGRLPHRTRERTARRRYS